MREFRLYKAHGLRSPPVVRQRLKQQQANEFADVHSLPISHVLQPVFQPLWHANGHLHVRWPAHMNSLARVITHAIAKPARIWARKR